MSRDTDDFGSKDCSSSEPDTCLRTCLTSEFPLASTLRESARDWKNAGSVASEVRQGMGSYCQDPRPDPWLPVSRLVSMCRAHILLDGRISFLSSVLRAVSRTLRVVGCNS